jgi:4-hydroxybenzoate polyprenyltransferase
MYLCQKIIGHRYKSSQSFDETYHHLFAEDTWFFKSMKIVKVLCIALLMLLIPSIGMIAFPHEVQWTIFNFVVAFILFSITGLLISFIPRRFQKKKNKVLYIGFILAIMFLMWLELAVGIIGCYCSGS